MKRFAAIILTVLFLFLSGCEKSAEEYISDIGGFFETHIFSLNASEKIDESNTVVIRPDDINISYGPLSAYNRLTQSQKNLYAIMLKACEDMELRLIDVTEYSSKDLYSQTTVVQRAILSDRPDMFWTPKTVSVVSVGSYGKKYICFKDYDDKEDSIGFYGISKSDKEKMQTALTETANSIISKVNNYSSDFYKELFIHDYICENIVYDDESANNLDAADPDSVTAYGALIKGKAICEGYSKAMQYLCLKCGIDCNIVCGEYDNTAHMWNIILIGDGLYYLDVTFDDASDVSVYHKYFNITKNQILKDHIFYNELSNKVSYEENDNFNFFCDDCKNTAFNYYEHQSAFIKNDCEQAIKAVLTAYEKGQTKAELKNATLLPLSDAVNLLVSRLGSRVIIKKYYDCSDNTVILLW